MWLKSQHVEGIGEFLNIPVLMWPGTHNYPLLLVPLFHGMWLQCCHNFWGSVL